MLRVFSLFLLALVVMAAPVQAQQRREGIAAIVNNAVITVSDVNERVKLVISSAGLPDTGDVRGKVRAQVIGALIDETIKAQEAKRVKISVDDNEVDQAIDNIASQNKMTGAQFRSMLRSRGIKVSSLKEQIRNQILWVKTVTKRLRPQINITEADIDAELDRLKERAGKEEMWLGEIVLPVDRGQGDGEMRALADRLIRQIRSKPEGFPSLARQFSASAGAAAGGDLGWVSPAQMGGEVGSALAGALKGSVVGPVKSPAGLHVFLVRDRRMGMTGPTPSRDAIANRLGLERLERLQRGYFLDLKSTAYIEKRG